MRLGELNVTVASCGEPWNDGGQTVLKRPFELGEGAAGCLGQQAPCNLADRNAALVLCCLVTGIGQRPAKVFDLWLLRPLRGELRVDRRQVIPQPGDLRVQVAALRSDLVTPRDEAGVTAAQRASQLFEQASEDLRVQQRVVRAVNEFGQRPGKVAIGDFSERRQRIRQRDGLRAASMRLASS